MLGNTQEKSHKTNIKPKIFYSYIFLVFLFVMIYSINFLIMQLIEKSKVIESTLPNLIPGINDAEYSQLYDKAKQTWNLWSFPSYIGGLSTVFIFFVFVLFGKTKVKYGYFFRTIWSIIFIGAAIFIYFIEFMPLWQKIIDSIIVACLAALTIYELVKVNDKREQLKFEIRNEWTNRRNNADAR